MSVACAICGGPVNPYDRSTWKEVTGWVGGPRRDSMRLRRDTGRYAHNHCVGKTPPSSAEYSAMLRGEPVDQLDILEPQADSEATPQPDESVEEFFDGD